MQTDHGHSPEEVAARLAAGRRTTHLKDMIYGGIDGAVTTFAIVAGVEGAGLSSGVIVTLGMANILADGFSMAASNYSGTKAELDDRARIRRIEERHLEQFKSGELEELRQILALRGLSGEVLDQATALISHNKPKWIDLMLTDEYGLSPTPPNPLRASLATFAAFLAAGSIPLLPYLIGLDGAFRLSVLTTLLTFFLIGAGKSRWSLARWWWSGTETLAIGALAAAIAFGVGSLFHP
ncbi:VIT1/CCC1 transporter family protein [Roseobacter sinensis]|uniref:VIT1/CCC1 transporter family protein n=1 Tax=Roseobacter sinensis TaxID=2931391 RepID=A0ABT3BEC0_9RHOB|nr:VIT1/CCC1 transporter family protein [Roseobacter sp. WL0113]MCV3271499.1 VIT1/CCC1 transporter family protein [Roseobacter sp. WL0113]